MPRDPGKEASPDLSGVWPHERRCARSLSASGRHVEFIPVISGNGVKTADLVMDGVAWELKSPESSDVRSLQRTLRRAAKQSPNVIIDSSRATKLSDIRIERELRRLMPLVKSVRRLLLVTKDGEVVDLSR